MSKGKYIIKVVAKSGKTVVTDEITQEYQTEKWDKPTQLVLNKIGEENGVATIEVRALDNKSILCLDAINSVEFLLAGDGKLIDNQGTSSGSRKVQLYNGRAIIKVMTLGGSSVAGVKSQGLKTVFLDLH